MKITNDKNQVIRLAWIRDGNGIITGPAVVLACLLHCTGAGRDSDDMKYLQKMLDDPNLED